MLDTVVVGLGNPLFSDEGIGVRMIAELSAHLSEPEIRGVSLADAGTNAARVLHVIAGKRKAIFVDCAFMDEEPGTIRKFRPEEAESRKVLESISFHNGDLLGTLALSRRLGECPEEVLIFGIQPQDICPGESLSPRLAFKMPEYIQVVIQELEKEII